MAKKNKRFTPLDWLNVGFLFILYSLLFPFYRFVDFIAATLVCIGTGLVLASIRRRRAKTRPAPIPASGDKTADALIAQGKRSLETLESLQKQIHDPGMQQGITRIIEIGRMVFLAISEKPERASSARTFTEYYLPTAVNLLSSYARLQDDALHVSEGHITNSMDEIRASLGTITEAFERQLDTLYRDEWIDISSDIAVLESIVKREGFAQPKSS